MGYIDSFSAYPDPKSERVPVGHGGKGETQLIMAALPETVRMEALDTTEELPRWFKDAGQTDAIEGRRWIEFCVQGWVQELGRCPGSCLPKSPSQWPEIENDQKTFSPGRNWAICGGD